jgi:endonuclease III
MPARSRRPDPSPSSPAERVIARLAQVFPGATTELHYRNAFELLVATILSAQSTDARVNLVTPALFARHPDAASLATANQASLEEQIKSTGFFRAKSRALIAMATELVARFGGEVPASMDELVSLPSVGRKTANVVLGHALGVPGLPVDRHVQRVATRIGLARGRTAEAIEQELCAVLPASQWTLASDCLILHGRRTCRPRPLCDRCVVREDCEFYTQGYADAVRVPGAGATAPAATRAARTPTAARASRRKGGRS